MQFGRLDGFVTTNPDGSQWLTVVLDTGRELSTVRDEPLPQVLHDQDLEWLADQLVQETIGNELAVEGWEVIGEGDAAHEEHVMIDIVARSRTWVVRRV